MGVVYHVRPVGHAYHQDVVQLVHPVYLGQQLVDHGVIDPSVPSHGASLLTDSINLIKYDDMQARVHTNIFVKNLGTINNLRLPCIQHLPYLPGHECLASTRGAVEQNPLHMGTPQLLHYLGREHTGGKSSPEDGIKLLIQSTNTHLGKVPVRVDDGLSLHLPLALSSQLHGGTLCLVEY